jgi:hypothetical protein
MLYMSYTSSRVFFMWVYECVFATLVECSLIEKSNEFFYSCKGGWSRPIHHVLLLDWYFVCLDWSSEWHVHRSKICSLTICLCIFPHSWRFFLFELRFSSSAMTRVWPQAKSSTCVSVDKEYGHATTYAQSRRPRRAFLFNNDPVCRTARYRIAISVFIFSLSFHWDLVYQTA